MAGIPQYQPQEQTRPLPTPYNDNRVPAAAEGAPIGDAVQQGGEVLAQYAHQAKVEADAAAVVQAEARLGDAYNAAIFDPQNGYIAKRGRDALGAYGDTVKSLTTARENALKSLANEDQQRVFFRRSQETFGQALKQVQVHQFQQTQQLADDSYKAREATSYNTLANIYGDQDGRQSEMLQMHDVILSDARRIGADATVTKAMLQSYDQKAHAVVLDQMLGRQLATQAKAYFDENRAALGTLADNYEKRVREVGVAQRSDVLARQLLADPANRIAGTVLPDQAAIVAKVGGLQEPIEVKDATLQRALHYANVNTEAQDSRNSQVFGRALADMDKAGLVNPNDLAYLNDPKNGAGKYADTLKQMQRRNLEQDINAPPTVAQEAAFGKAQLAIGADQREYWASQSYEQMAGTYGAQVTRAQLGQLANDLDQAHKWSEEQNRADRSQAIQTQVRDRLIKGSGFNKDPAKWSDDQWAVFSRALTDVKAQQQAFLSKTKGVQPTPDDVKAWIDKPMAKVKVVGSGFIWDDQPVRAAADVLPQYQGKQAAYVIPSNEQKLIDQQLKQQGFPVNDQNRQTLYRRRHGF